MAVVSLAVALALGPQVSAPASGSQGEPDAQAVLDAVTRYQKVLDAQWTDPSASTGSSTTTKTEQVNQRIRDRHAKEGGAVTSASSEVELEKAVLQDDGTVLATVIVATTQTYEDTDGPSIATDPHEMTLEGSDAAGYTVVEDVVPKEPPQPGAGEVPEGYDLGDSPQEEPQPAYNKASPDVEAVVAYALRWTGGANHGDKRSQLNPRNAYPYEEGSNCANFVSQALHDGGWETELETDIDGADMDDVSNIGFWAPNVEVAGPRGEIYYSSGTYTWINASYQHTYVRRGGYERLAETIGAEPTKLGDVKKARPGDLIYTDWDPNGKADGELDHVMIVTGVTPSGEPMISQKTNNRHNMRLSDLLEKAQGPGQDRTSINLYAVTPEGG